MSIAIYDKNFLYKEAVIEEEIAWYPVSSKLFDVYGFLASDDAVLSRRIPEEVAAATSTGVHGQHTHAAGGRVRFSTDSPFIALRVVYGTISNHTVCTGILNYGFDINCNYPDGREIFIAAFRPTPGDCITGTPITYRKNIQSGDKMQSFTLNMPHFASVTNLMIGLKVGSSLGRGEKYVNDLIFYL